MRRIALFGRRCCPYTELVMVSVWVHTQRKEGKREIGSLKKSSKLWYDVVSTSINIPHKTVTSSRRQASDDGAQVRHFSRRVRPGKKSGLRTERGRLPEKLPLSLRCYRGISLETPVHASKILSRTLRKAKTREWVLIELTSTITMAISVTGTRVHGTGIETNAKWSLAKRSRTPVTGTFFRRQESISYEHVPNAFLATTDRVQSWSTRVNCILMPYRYVYAEVNRRIPR